MCLGGEQCCSHAPLSGLYLSIVGISAVLYSTAHVFAYRKLGTGFKLVHNPKTRAPIPKGFLKIGSEYWMEEDKLICKQYGANFE